MKLQQEYESLKKRVELLDKQKVIAYRDQLQKAGGYKDFNTRFAWDILYSVTETKTICEWYAKYKCNDKHITTLAVKVCKELGYLMRQAKS